MRDQLAGELEEIASSDNAAIRAYRILGVKNSLTELDSRQVEDAFRAKLATFENVSGQSSPPIPPGPQRSPSGLAQQPLSPAGAVALPLAMKICPPAVFTRSAAESMSLTLK